MQTSPLLILCELVPVALGVGARPPVCWANVVLLSLQPQHSLLALTCVIHGAQMHSVVDVCLLSICKAMDLIRSLEKQHKVSVKIMSDTLPYWWAGLVRACACVYRCKTRGHQMSSSLSTLFFEAESLTEPGARHFIKPDPPASAPRIHLSLLPRRWDCRYVTPRRVFTWMPWN